MLTLDALFDIDKQTSKFKSILQENIFFPCSDEVGLSWKGFWNSELFVWNIKNMD